MFAFLKQWSRFEIGAMLCMLLLAAFRLWQVAHFNPLWGYDGGGHVRYITSLADGRGIPSLRETYMAWHEPLYYLLQSGWLRFVRVFAESERMQLLGLSLFQWMLGLAVSGIAYLTARAFSVSRTAAFLGVLAWSLLSPLIQATTFVTSELLNYFWILTLSWFFFRFLWKRPASIRPYLLFGVLSGLALLTKITTIIPIAIYSVALLFFALRARDSGSGLRVFAALLLAFLLVLPWHMYRSAHGLSSLSVNNYDFMAPAPLRLDHRLWFFTKFDSDIFAFPYWYSGGRGFWSMFYADTFWDYYGMLENRDALALLPPHASIRTTVNDTFVSSAHLRFASPLPFLALPLLALFCVGAWSLVRRARSSGFLGQEIWIFFFVGGFLAALFYFAYRYPFYDRGIVKSIFIAPMFLPLLIFGFEELLALYRRKPVLTGAWFFAIALYFGVLLLSVLLSGA